jgi:hypothetical protein
MHEIFHRWSTVKSWKLQLDCRTNRALDSSWPCCLATDGVIPWTSPSAMHDRTVLHTNDKLHFRVVQNGAQRSNARRRIRSSMQCTRRKTARITPWRPNEPAPHIIGKILWRYYLHAGWPVASEQPEQQNQQRYQHSLTSYTKTLDNQNLQYSSFRVETSGSYTMSLLDFNTKSCTT